MVVDGHLDVGVAVGAVAGDGDFLGCGWAARAGARESDLSALGVELRSVRLVQGDQLVTDEVVTGGEVGDGAGELLVAADELGDLPAGWLLAVEVDAAAGGEACLVDLEPAGTGAVA